MKKVLWLVSWFPNREEPLTGDFLERHAVAASQLNKVHVLYVRRVNSAKSSREIVRKVYDDKLSSVIAYYYISAHSRLSSLFSFITYCMVQKKLIDEYVRENGKPDLVHVHISFKAGIGALYAKMRYGTKYVVSEQWTIFCPNAIPNFDQQPVWAKWLMRKIFRGAAASTAVSKSLASSLQQRFGIREPARVPNVVDTKLFSPADKSSLFRFIHISTLTYQKNPEGILKAVHRVSELTETPFELVIYGPASPAVSNLITDYGIGDLIRLRGEVMHGELAADLRTCHALILFSRFETFGCVIVEAYAAGVPVIVSDIPVMREIVQENITGVLVAPESPDALATAMLWMMNNHHYFNPDELAEIARQKFSFDLVARQFNAVYDGVLCQSS